MELGLTVHGWISGDPALVQDLLRKAHGDSKKVAVWLSEMGLGMDTAQDGKSLTSAMYFLQIINHTTYIIVQVWSAYTIC